MEMNDADRIDCHRFGMSTRKNTRGHDEPSEREASHSVFTSMEFSPTASARKANGMTSTTYAKHSQIGLVLSTSADSHR